MADPNDPLSCAKEILESEPVTNLLSPVTKEIGEFFGDMANMARFYITTNLERIFKSWAEYRHGRTIDAEAFKRVMPLLPLASMVSEDELQKRWAALMENAVTGDNFLPSFGQTLSQLTAEEVRYLDRLWKVILNPIDDHLPLHRFGRDPLSWSKLVQVFDSDIDTGVSPVERNILGGQFTDEQKANYERLGHVMLVIEDLVRLGIIDKDLVVEDARLKPGQTKTHPVYSFSEYGVSFMQAVTVKGSVET